MANDNTTIPGDNPSPNVRNRDQLRQVFDRYSTNRQNNIQRNTNNTSQDIMNLLDRQRRSLGDLRNLTQARLKSSIENREIPSINDDRNSSSYVEHAKAQSQTLVSMDGKLEDLLLSQRTVQRDVNRTLYGILELLSRKNRDDGSVIINNYYGDDSGNSGNILPNIDLDLGRRTPRPTPVSRPTPRPSQPSRPFLPSSVSNFIKTGIRATAGTIAGVAATAAAIHGAFRLSDYLTPEDQKGAQRRAPEEVQTLISQNRNVKFTRDVEPFKSGEIVSILQVLERFNIPANQSVEFITQMLNSRQIELSAQETTQQSIPSTPPTPTPQNNTETDIVRAPGESTRDFNRRVRENQRRNLMQENTPPSTRGLVNPASYTPEENDATPVDDDIDDNENILSLSRTIVSQITAQNQRQENETIARYRVSAQDYAINVQRTFTLSASRIIFNAENIEIHTDQEEDENDVVEPFTPVVSGSGGIGSVGRIFSGRAGGGGNSIVMGPGPGVGRGENGGSMVGGPSIGAGRSGSGGGVSGDRAVSTQVPPEGRALLDAIAQGEGGRHGYNAINYVAARTHGPRFEDFSRHPFQGQSGYTAAGRYQILWNTFAPYAQRLGLTDFSPESQDRAAWALAVDVYARRTRRNLEEDLKNPQMFESITSALAPTWHALRGGGGDRFIETLRQRMQNPEQTQVATGTGGQGASITPTASAENNRPTQQVAAALPTAYQPPGNQQRQTDAVQEEGEGNQGQQDAQPVGQEGSTEGLTFAPNADPNITPGIANIVRRVQSVVGPVTITSGRRSPEENSQVGGATNSRHLTGEAVDIQFAAGMQVGPRAIQVASEAGAGGIGVYDGWIHLDTGPKRTWQGRGGQPWAQQVLAAHMSGNASDITPNQGGVMVPTNPATGAIIARQSVGREVEQGTAEVTARPRSGPAGMEATATGGGAAGGIGGGLDIGSVHPAPGLMAEFSRESGQPSIIRPPAQMGMGLHRTPSFTA